MKVLVLLPLILLGGCAGTYVATSEPFCRSVKTVWVGKDDVISESTAKQIEADNLARQRLCGRSAPPRG